MNKKKSSDVFCAGGLENAYQVGSNRLVRGARPTVVCFLEIIIFVSVHSRYQKGTEPESFNRTIAVFDRESTSLQQANSALPEGET